MKEKHTILNDVAISEEDMFIMMLKKKDYVRAYIKNFFQAYDFDSPVTIQGSMLPSCIMEEDLLRGGMGKTREECLDWIYMDPEAAENTATYIKDKYPELSGMTPETDPGRFSLLMMEREIYKMIYEADVVDDNWDREFVLDRQAVMEICEAAGIAPPENVRWQMQTKDLELE